MKDWHSVCIDGKKKQPPPPKKGGSWANVPNINAKACMISGSPGIGKSSMVKIIAEHMGFGVREINASDKRSKKVKVSYNIAFLTLRLGPIVTRFKFDSAFISKNVS